MAPGTPQPQTLNPWRFALEVFCFLAQLPSPRVGQRAWDNGRALSKNITVYYSTVHI